MSYSIVNNSIELTRGDTLRTQVGIEIDDVEYKPQEGDVVRFALKRNILNKERTEYIDEQPLCLKNVPTDTMILTLDPSDTKNLGFGRYVYDMEITFADGTVATFITKAPFKITEEVD